MFEKNSEKNVNTKLVGKGVRALVTGQLKKPFIAASLSLAERHTQGGDKGVTPSPTRLFINSKKKENREKGKERYKVANLGKKISNPIFIYCKKVPISKITPFRAYRERCYTFLWTASTTHPSGSSSNQIILQIIQLKIQLCKFFMKPRLKYVQQTVFFNVKLRLYTYYSIQIDIVKHKIMASLTLIYM